MKQNAMALERLRISPYVTKSEPGTPVYVTSPIPFEAPEHWFAPVAFKEYLAIMTMEHIPSILRDAGRDHTTTSTDQYFSPRLMPLMDRMKFHLSRMMARARYEANNGPFGFGGNLKEQKSQELPIEPGDVMSSVEVEAFLAGIEEIRLPGKDDRILYRRYWRIMDPPAGVQLKLGGVICSSSTLKHHLEQGVADVIHEHWDSTPKVLVAEFEVHADGRSKAGKMLRED